MHGFTKKDWGDHEFAAYLRKTNAIDNVLKCKDCNMWYNDNDLCVAVAFYNNQKCKYTVWVRNNYLGEY
jgi:hypothetical protein